MSEAKPNPLNVALHQLNIAAEHLNLDSGIHEVLKHPKRALIVSCPVKMDDGTVKAFLGCRVQHNDARGPFKGGVRYHPDVTCARAIVGRPSGRESRNTSGLKTKWHILNKSK